MGEEVGRSRRNPQHPPPRILCFVVDCQRVRASPAFDFLANFFVSSGNITHLVPIANQSLFLVRLGDVGGDELDPAVGRVDTADAQVTGQTDHHVDKLLLHELQYRDLGQIPHEIAPQGQQADDQDREHESVIDIAVDRKQEDEQHDRENPGPCLGLKILLKFPQLAVLEFVSGSPRQDDHDDCSGYQHKDAERVTVITQRYEENRKEIVGDDRQNNYSYHGQKVHSFNSLICQYYPLQFCNRIILYNLNRHL